MHDDDWFEADRQRRQAGDPAPLPHDEDWWERYTARLEAAARACGWIEPEKEEPKHEVRNPCTE